DGSVARRAEPVVFEPGRRGLVDTRVARRQLAGGRGDRVDLPRRHFADHAQHLQPGRGRAALLRHRPCRGAARPARHFVRRDLARGWSLTPAVFTQRFKADDIDAAYLEVGGFQLPAGATPPSLALFQTSKPLREPSKDRLTVPSLTLNGDVGFGDLTGILSG